MKTRLIKLLLILVGVGAVVAGCETTGPQTANLDLEFSPPPPMQDITQ